MGIGIRQSRWLVLAVAFSFSTFASVEGEDRGKGTTPGTAELPAGAPGDTPSLEFLAGGLRIEKMREAGWSHLVMIQTPLITSGEINLIPDSKRADLTFGTVVLAEVDPSAGPALRPVLRRIGVGLVQTVQGHDTTVTMGTRDTLGVAQSREGKFVLYHTEQELKRSRLIAATAKCAVLSINVKLARGQEHKKASLRFALLLEPEAGVLHTLVWPSPAGTGADLRSPPELSSIRLLEPNLRFESPTDLMIERAFGLVPKGFSLAMRELPPGRSLALSANLRSLLSTRDDQLLNPHELEASLQDLLTGLARAPGQTPNMPAGEVSTPRAPGPQTGTAAPGGSLRAGGLASTLAIGMALLLASSFWFRRRRSTEGLAQ
jgi:hypothetical protein